MDRDRDLYLTYYIKAPDWYWPKGKTQRLEEKEAWASAAQAHRVSTIASMVPDEIIYKQSDHSVRDYETALMFIDVSGSYGRRWMDLSKVGKLRVNESVDSYTVPHVHLTVYR